MPAVVHQADRVKGKVFEHHFCESCAPAVERPAQAKSSGSTPLYCQSCGKPSVVHITEKRGSEKSESHLCQECAKQHVGMPAAAATFARTGTEMLDMLLTFLVAGRARAVCIRPQSFPQIWIDRKWHEIEWSKVSQEEFQKLLELVTAGEGDAERTMIYEKFGHQFSGSANGDAADCEITFRIMS
jgi:hypothetical protein